MNWEEYVEFVGKTRQYPELGVTGLSYPLLKLMGEFSEFLKNPTIDEAGDILWYVVDIHYLLGIPPETTFQGLPVVTVRYINKEMGEFYELVGKFERKKRFNQEDRNRLINLLPKTWKPLQYAMHTLRMTTHPMLPINVVANRNMEKLWSRLKRNVIIGEGDNR